MLKAKKKMEAKMENDKRLRAIAIKDRIERDRQKRMNERAKKKEMRRFKRFKDEEKYQKEREQALKQKALNKALGIVSPKIPKTKRLKEEAVKHYWAKHGENDALELLLLVEGK